MLEVSDEGEHDIENNVVEVVEYHVVRTFITFGPFAVAPKSLKRVVGRYVLVARRYQLASVDHIQLL